MKAQETAAQEAQEAREAAEQQAVASGVVTGLISIPACADYKRQIARLNLCKSFPNGTIQTLRDSFAQMDKNWQKNRASASSGAR